MSSAPKKTVEKLTPQQKWNEKNKEKRKESGRKQREKYKRIEIKLDKENDRELIEWLASCNSQQETIYDLIKQAYLQEISTQHNS